MLVTMFSNFASSVKCFLFRAQNRFFYQFKVIILHFTFEGLYSTGNISSYSSELAHVCTNYYYYY